MSRIRLDIEGSVATLVLNRPEARNALDAEMCDEIAAAIHRIDESEGARAAIVRGEGSVFCAGADFGSVSSAGPEFVVAFERMLETVSDCRVPTVAAIDGAALGGGFQLASACDFRLSDPRAKIGIPAARLGVLVNLENIERLVRLVGTSVARRVLLTAETFAPAESQALGLVDVVVEDVLSEAKTLADRLASLAPLSVQGTKRLLRAIEKSSNLRSRDPGAADEHDRLVVDAYGSSDLQEGINALSSKRDPRFEGK